MGIRLSEIVNDLRDVEINIGEHTINVGYRPNAMTLPMLAELDTLGRMTRDDAMDTLINLMICTIAKWDLLDNDDVPLEITNETLQRVPYRLLSSIMEVINQDFTAVEKKMRSVPSGAISQREGNTEPRRNGTPSFGPVDT